MLAQRDHDQIVDAEQGHATAFAGVEDDVVFRVEFGDRFVGAIVRALAFQIGRHGKPGADVVPIEGGFDV